MKNIRKLSKQFVVRILDSFVSETWRSEIDDAIVACEQRLAYSAVPLADSLDELLGSLAEPIAPASNESGEMQQLETHLLQTPQSIPEPQVNLQPYANFLGSNLPSTPAHALTGLDQARQMFGLSGAGQTVAVIDTGIAYDHIALGGGFGANFRVVGGYDFAENDANPYDDGPAGYHGTAVAGVVGGSRFGVATNVDLVALRVFDDMGKSSLQAVESALRWVHANYKNFENPISIVNLSLGVDYNTTSPPAGSILEDELQALRNDGILVIASAGNSFSKYKTPGLAYPASSSLVLPVASVDANGSLSDFSQRDSDVIAAPGRQISSTVPDAFLGADGKFNDYSTVSGTSFSAPYVAGASALLREAFELVGNSNPSVDSIRHALFSTADTIYDAVTNANYSRLNILRALDSIIPDDNVGDSAQTAFNFGSGVTHSGSLAGFLNRLGDVDQYQWNATTSGTLELDFNSAKLLGSQWLVNNGLEQSTIGADGILRINVQAGTNYGFAVTDADQIGSFNIDWKFTANSVTPVGPTGTPVELGAIDVESINATGGGLYALKTVNDGLLSVQLGGNGGMQSIRLYDANGKELIADQTIENGLLRLDFQVSNNTRYLVQANFQSGNANLDIANVVSRNGTEYVLHGSDDTDNYSIDLSNGVVIDVGAIEYSIAKNAISKLTVELDGGADNLSVKGSSNAETVYLYSNHGSVRNTDMLVEWTGSEKVSFDGVSGPDRVYAFDTDGNDQLTIHPRRFQLDGAGYQFIVTQAERLYVDASRGGNDQAYMFDSEGNDQLSIRPQFSSLRGSGYFSFVTGFERVYAYSTAGGIDSATLYDSKSNDSFATNGDSASIVGSGYYSYTRFFETVESISSAGGYDTASIFSPQDASNHIGSDFVSFEAGQWSRTARGFHTVQASIVQSASNLKTNGEVEEVASEQPSTPAWSVKESLTFDAIDVTRTQDAFILNTEAPRMPLSPMEVSNKGAYNFGDASLERYSSAAASTSQPESEQSSPLWVSEAPHDVYALRHVDPLTLSLMDEEREKISLAMFFETLGEAIERPGVLK